MVPTFLTGTGHAKITSVECRLEALSLGRCFFLELEESLTLVSIL
jgi:hypothetical protein